MLPWLLWVGLFAGTSLGQSMFTQGQKWQIILTGQPDMTKSPLPPTDAPVWDIDLFDNDLATITALKAQGKVVICYFSAGTWEDWRDDAKDFPAADIGKVLPEWPNEKWIRTGSAKIRDIMAKRIKIAADKGCDALDPDNTDGYQNDNGLNLKNTDLIDYMRWLQKNASAYGMKIGLKNSLDILNTVAPIMDFAVNEQCAQLTECFAYNQFLASGKPVFHIEYPSKLNPVPDAEKRNFCNNNSTGVNGMSTVLKNLTLNGLTIYCDGSQVDTPTKGGTGPGRPPRPTSRPTSMPTSRPTSRPTSMPPSIPPNPSTTSTSRPPTSTPGNGGGGGCRQKHWDQCGGQDWKGCTVCEVGYTTFSVPRLVNAFVSLTPAFNLAVPLSMPGSIAAMVLPVSMKVS
ncbi:carbohydrate-binding module family 1 protein [Zopfia rhizophila CBS 207.26]|uniref:alpha-galactosidase n=1 Tax=Zopfia rhizophila CBS 207.26 TaxID=1314779 RepID=A0A6A6E4T5_9PEZI|nr:carbohydrate-binding module family 1 protein [Zopfia rhizophila CBS 207.26]